MRYPNVDEVMVASGTATLDNRRRRESILQIKGRDVIPAGCDGLATVTLFVETTSIVPAVVGGNDKLVVECKWESGASGGRIVLDGDHGAVFSVPGTSAITMYAEIVSSVEGAPLVVSSTKRVETVVKWKTSGTSHHPLFAPPMTPVDAGGFSAFIPIPPQARLVSFVTRDAGARAGMVAEFATQAAAAAIVYRTPAPDRHEIVQGVQFVRFSSVAATLVAPVFHLWP